MLSGETEGQRWEEACPRSSSRSVAELDAELRSLLGLFLSLILRECCLPPGTAVPGISWVWGSDRPLCCSAVKCLSDLHTVHSRAVLLLGAIPPAPLGKFGPKPCPLPVVTFLDLIL